MAATPDQYRAIVKIAENAMRELDSLRGKAEIPAWEKKEMKEQRALARAKKKWAEKQLASVEKKPVAKKATTKTKPAPSKGRSGGGTGAGRGGVRMNPLQNK